MNNKKGFTSVFLVTILLSVVLVTGTFAEASAGYAARSTADGILRLAGDSVLAEYDRKLLKDYGLFGVTMDETFLEEQIRKYAEAGFAKDPGYSNFLRLELKSLECDLSQSSLLSSELLVAQILAYMEGRILADPELWNGLFRLVGQLGDLTGLIDTASGLADEFQAAKALLEEVSAQEEGDVAYAEEQYANASQNALGAISDLQELIQDIGVETPLDFPEILPEISNDTANSEDEKLPKAEQKLALVNDVYIAMLPSRLLQVDKGMAFSLSAGSSGLVEGIKENFLISAYALKCFDHHLKAEPREDHYFLNEGEYLLFGQMSDEANYSRMKASLMTLRTALNLVHIYTDQAKYEETLALAMSILPGPAAPILQFVIALAWAGSEAGKDMERLEEEGKVPLFKTADDWILSLSGTLENSGADGDDGRGLSYENYLFLFLLLADKEAKLVRIMDLVQLNLQGAHDGSFAMKNCHCQVSFTAEVVRQSGFFGKRGQRFGIFTVHREYDG